MDKNTMKNMFVDYMMELHSKIIKRKYNKAKQILEELNDDLDSEDTNLENKYQEKRNLVKDTRAYIKLLVGDILDNYPENYSGNDNKKIEYKSKVDEHLKSLQEVVNISFWKEIKEYFNWS